MQQVEIMVKVNELPKILRVSSKKKKKEEKRGYMIPRTRFSEKGNRGLHIIKENMT